MKRSSRILALLFVMMAAGLTWGEEGPPLTEAAVKGFIASLPDLDALGRELKIEDSWVKAPSGPPDGAMMGSPLAATVAAMQGHAAAGRIREVIRKHGFADIMPWAQAGDRIIRAFIALKVDGQDPEMAAQMKKAIEDIDKSEMPAEQKQAMKDMMLSSRKTMAAYGNAPQGDRDLVEKHMQLLEETLEKAPKKK